MGAEPKALQKLEFLDKDVLLVKASKPSWQLSQHLAPSVDRWVPQVPPELGRVWTEACQRSSSCTNAASEDAHRELGTMTLRQALPPVGRRIACRSSSAANVTVLLLGRHASRG
jgi:hypothetical protein